MAGYRELLDATISHLEGLQESGERLIEVDRLTLAGLMTKAVRLKPGADKAPVLAPKTTPGERQPAAAAVPRSLPSGAAARWNRAVAGSGPANRIPGPAVSSSVTPGPAGAPAPKRDPAAKEAAMNDLRRRAAECIRCPHLASSRRSVVVGVGDVNARLLFVGEAPGADEDRQGEPFVGAAGELLTRILVAMNLSRDQVFIANVLKCRPDTPGQSHGNRKPTPGEMATCLPWLQEQIEILQPEVMVALGATAVEGLLGRPMSITRLRGQWQDHRGIPLMPTYHPAYLLRSQSPADKRRVWEDMLAVMERLAMPISERQRGFFLPKP
ncbi:MAG: uracil-DNA glycosylase [Verrucomicrobia bacterium]|nr:uracil-DNA glycosylase [Verrucomicrobiota bacterium]